MQLYRSLKVSFSARLHCMTWVIIIIDCVCTWCSVTILFILLTFFCVRILICLKFFFQEFYFSFSLFLHCLCLFMLFILFILVVCAPYSQFLSSWNQKFNELQMWFLRWIGKHFYFLNLCDLAARVFAFQYIFGLFVRSFDWQYHDHDSSYTYVLHTYNTE